MHPTCFIYSSHDRCEYIHRWWIVERALKSHTNKTILYLPMSENSENGEFGSAQQFGWSKFEWYLNFFRKWGLDSHPFYWNNHLTQEDAHVFFDMVRNYEVVILGGGNSSLGLMRYKLLGKYFFNDENLFAKILHERQNQGLLTVGFSAGADQLCSILASQISYNLSDPIGFGLAHNIIATLHHDADQKGEIFAGAQKFPHCMVFGLPNDAGLAVSQGFLPSGNIWQIIEFVTDKSWDIPRDQFHIKTRMGQGIDHFYNDGRDWTFHGGDRMARVIAPDSSWQDAFVFLASGGCFHYGSQNEANFSSLEEVFSHY